MNRPLAALCVLSLASSASAGLLYNTDSRLVQAVNSFGQNSAKTPPIPFAPFNESAQTSTSMAEGACSSTALHDSQMNATQMSGSGSVVANVQTKAPSPLVFASSGTSRFEIVFTPDVSGTLQLTGQFAGTPGKSTLSVQLRQGSTTLFSKTTAGTFENESFLTQNQEYRLFVSCAANGLLTWSGTPAEAASSASFSFTAALVSDTCTGDLNLDGFVDDLDFVIFSSAYNILDCADQAMPVGCPADLNHDTFVDDADFIIFVPAYDALLCP